MHVAIVALPCGNTSLNAIAQWMRQRVADDPEVLIALGLSPGRAPYIATFHRIFDLRPTFGPRIMTVAPAPSA